MAYTKKTDEKVKWNATEILNADGQKHLVWQLRVPTGWKNHTRVYREIQEPVFVDEKDL